MKYPLTLLATSAIATATVASVPAQAEQFIGQITAFPYNFCPRNTAEADGRLLSIASNDALFALLGTTYGGNGTTTFALPNLSGRVPIGRGQGQGLSDIRLGQMGGTETTTLTVNNLPTHTHSTLIRANPTNGNSDTPVSNYLSQGRGKDSTTIAPTNYMNRAEVVVGSAGSNQSFNSRAPYLGIRYCVTLFGIFPSRN